MRRAAVINCNTVTRNSTTPIMANASGPPPDFFASDDESDTGGVAPAETLSSEAEALAGPSIPSSQTSNENPAVENPLFLPDEEDADDRDVPIQRRGSVSFHPDVHPTEDVGMSDVFGIPQEKGSKSVTRYQSEEVFRPKKRKKLSPPSDSDFTFAFLGSVVIANAWSTVKGKGYIKNGDPIFVEWDSLKQEDEPPRKSDKKPPQKKSKQLTITALMKPRQDNFKKKKKNDIVRLTNRGGFGGFL